MDDFSPSRGQKRTLRLGKRHLEVRMGKPQGGPERLALYEKHKTLRGLRQSSHAPLSPRAYQHFLVERCVDAFELTFVHEGSIVGVAVSDRGENAISLVYCYYDPEFDLCSVGGFNVLYQLELCRAWGLEHAYLGLYIAENPHMNYKAEVSQHERRVDGVWRKFDRLTPQERNLASIQQVVGKTP